MICKPIRKRYFQAAWPVLLLGIVFLIYAFREPLGLAEIERWDTVEAIITDIRVESFIDRDGYTRYQTHLAYTFTVDDVTYHDELALPVRPSGAAAREEVRRNNYDEGTARVYYNTADPGQSTLYPVSTEPAIAHLIFYGVFCLVVGGLLLYSSCSESFDLFAVPGEAKSDAPDTTAPDEQSA